MARGGGVWHSRGDPRGKPVRCTCKSRRGAVPSAPVRRKVVLPLVFVWPVQKLHMWMCQDCGVGAKTGRRTS